MTHPWPLFDLVLRTSRLELRPPTDDDILALLDVALQGIHDASEMPFGVAWTDLPSPEFERSFLKFLWGTRASWTPEAWRLPLAVFHEGQPIGIQEVWAREFPTLRVVETGSWLGRRHQGRGYGTEMRAAVLCLAFEGLGAAAAQSGVVHGNDASRRVSEKLGYEPNGVDVVAPRGSPVPHYRYVLRRDRWKAGLYPVRIEGLDACLSMFGLAERPP